MMHSFLEVFDVFFSPLAIIFTFLFAGWVLVFFFRKTGLLFVSLGMILFIVFGLFPIGPNMMIYLEKQYSKKPVDDYIDGMIVLGGSFKTKHSAVHDMPVVNNNIERVLEGLRLNRQYPNAFLVFSGGNGLPDESLAPESDEVKRFMEDMAFSENSVIYEDRSRNTYENAVFTKELVRPLEREEWLLITSAYHMPRSMAVFEAAGWNVTPHPVDYRTDFEYSWIPSLKYIHKHLDMADLALHEFGGMIIYKLTGKL